MFFKPQGQWGSATLAMPMRPGLGPLPQGRQGQLQAASFFPRGRDRNALQGDVAVVVRGRHQLDGSRRGRTPSLNLCFHELPPEWPVACGVSRASGGYPGMRLIAMWFAPGPDDFSSTDWARRRDSPAGRRAPANLFLVFCPLANSSDRWGHTRDCTRQGGVARPI